MTGVDYIVLAHNRPDRVVRLVRALDGAASRFYVHYDKASDDRDFGCIVDALGARSVTMLRRRKCPWGRFGIVSATLDGIREFARDSDASHVVLVSGADYPIKSNDHIQQFLSERTSHSFLTTWAMPRPGWSHAGGIGRFDRWHFARHHPFPPARVIKAGHGPRRMPQRMKPYGGWQWITLNRSAAGWLTDHLEQHPNIERFFRTTHVPDEMMIQTMMHNSPFSAQIEPSLHYVDWSAGGMHPRTLSRDDVPSLVASPQLFARKFDNEDALDALDVAIANGG